MRRNRKCSKRLSVAASRSMHFAAVIMMLFVMVLVNLLAGSHCDQMMKTIGEKRALLAKLEKDRERESSRWDQINTPENLDRVLMHLGMAMKYPRPDQVVRMTREGVPERGQISVARDARRRADKTGVASNARPPSTRRKRR